MTALTARTPRKPLKGRERPRIAPPIPARSALKDWLRTCDDLGIDPYGWQTVMARYLYALAPEDVWLYPEAAGVVSRQNGKTEILIPHIIRRLRMSRRIMHTAQNRELPREVHGRVADYFLQHDRDALRTKPRFANGQEEIRLRNGGHYRIVAPTRSGARGPSNDDVLVDEVRELDDFDFIAAAKPTLTASRNPQILYLSNAGDDSSVVLNALRQRASEDPSLAYLEWSAPPELAADDVMGWLQANPSIGHNPSVLPYLEREYVSNKLAGTLSIFETEHLCRWVPTMRDHLVDLFTWGLCRAEEEAAPHAPSMAVSLDPQRRRASAAIAWAVDDGVRLQLLFDVTGDPIDTDALARDIREAAGKYGVRRVGYDPLTDAEIVKPFRKPEPISGQKFANASAQFAGLTAARSIRWQDADAVSDDLTWTARKLDRETGSFEAVRAQDDRPITASLAAIRAVWLASGLKQVRPKVM